VNREAALLASVVALCVVLDGCSRCGDEPQQVGSVPAYARLSLGSDEATLRTELAALGGFDPGGATRFVTCSDLARADILDVETPAMIEMAAPGHSLVRCTLMGGMFQRSGPFSSARGDLLDGRLFSAAWSFTPSDFDARRGELEAALGPGKEVRLEEESALGELQREAVVWRADGVQWALIRGLETRVVKQGDAGQTAFAPPVAPSSRGSKVSLDDIGLGGGLDLTKPLPSDEGLVPKDAGPR
jgi:hypothetical protein